MLRSDVLARILIATPGGALDRTVVERNGDPGLRGLVGVMTLLHSARDRDSVLEAVVAGVRDSLGYSVAAIRVLDDDIGALRTAAVVGPGDAVASIKGRTLSLSDLALELGWAALDDGVAEDVYFVPHENLPAEVVSTWVPDVPVVTEEGAWHPMDSVYVVLNDPAGQLLGVLGVDLPTDGRRPDAAQRELLQLYARQAALALHRTKLLDQQSRLVATLLGRQREADALVATLTHDLKAPLTVIRSQVEFAQEEMGDAPDDVLGPRLDGIERAVKRMTSTLDDLLDQHRAVGHGSALGIVGVQVDLAQLVREVVNVSRVVAERRGIVLELGLLGDDHCLLGDRQQLLRAVDNLVTNALKYTPSGGRVALSVDGRASEVVVTCADDGVGIPLDEHETVFVEYARAAHARSSGIEGTGLGLPIARRIVTAHQGTLSLDSTPGVGSTFVARFPRTVSLT